MKTITKTFSTLKQAERFQWKLYSKFDHVRLVQAPIFSESGRYSWKVK